MLPQHGCQDEIFLSSGTLQFTLLHEAAALGFRRWRFERFGALGMRYGRRCSQRRCSSAIEVALSWNGSRGFAGGFKIPAGSC